MWYASPVCPTCNDMISLTLPAALSCLPVATTSSMDCGAFGTRSVLRISAMFSMAYGTPYTWPLNVTAFIAMSANAPFCAADSCTGSMAPFCTRLPIQSCAPTTMSGALPDWEAVTKFVCRSLEIACTSTVTPLSLPNCSANGLSAAVRLSSAQMTSLPPAALAPPPAGAAFLSPPPQAEATSARAITATTPAVRIRMGVLLFGSSGHGRGTPDPGVARTLATCCKNWKSLQDSFARTWRMV